MIQNNDSLMMEKIQTSIMNTIPLWKNQMVISLGIADSQKAMEAAQGHRYDEPAAAEERGHAENGDGGDREGI